MAVTLSADSAASIASCTSRRATFNPAPNEPAALPADLDPPTPTDRPSAAWNIPAAVAAWLVPGLGHFLAGHTRRGLILLVCIGALWVSGLLIGGISVIQYRAYDRTVRPWYLGQALIAPSIAVEYTHDRYRAQFAGRDPRPDDEHIPYQPAYARAYELGTLYTALAGLLNLLAIIDIVYREPRSTEHILPLGAGHPAEPPPEAG